MEEENKIPTTPESNPNGDDRVNMSDIDDENEGQGDSKPTGDEKPNDQQKPSDDGQKPNPSRQDRRTDAEYAEERRKRKEREEALRKKRDEEIRRQAVFDVKKGQVTPEELAELGLQKVEDEDQLFLVESLRKAKASGAENPLATAYQELYKRQSAERAEAQERAKAEEAEKQKRIATVAQDQAAFKAKFGKTTAEVLKNEPEFVELFGKLIDQDKGNFTELYDAYTQLKAKHSDTARREGTFPTNSNGPANGDVSESDEEFKKRWIAEHGHW